MKVSGLHAFVAGTFDLTGFRAAMAALSGVRFLGESFQLGRPFELLIYADSNGSVPKFCILGILSLLI